MEATTEQTNAVRLSRAYAEYRDALWRYASRRTDHDDASDVVSTVFIIAWRKIDQMPEDPLPWLYKIAHYEVLKARRRRLHRTRLDSNLPVGHTVATVDDHEVVIDAIWVEQFLCSLRPADAELLRLLVWEDLDIARAATVLGCTTAAAHVRLHRIRKRSEARLRALADLDHRKENGTT